MSIFPFMNEEDEEETEEEHPFVELAFDFEKNCLLTKNGQYYYVEGTEAIKVWIHRAFRTKRSVYLAYSDQYGSDIAKNAGNYLPGEAFEAFVRSDVEEMLLVNDYITGIDDFEYEYAGSRGKIHFLVHTKYGDMEIEEIM